MNRFVNIRLFALATWIYCSFLPNLAFAQTASEVQEINLFDKYIVGKGLKPEGASLFAEVYPIFLFSGGFGANIGYGTGHWEFGATYIGVPNLMDAWRDWFLAGAEGVSIKQNTGLEVFANYFIRPDRQGFYVGVIGGPEWYDIQDNSSEAREMLVRAYVVPRFGVRWFPFQPYFYVDTSIGPSFNVSGSEERKLGSTSYSVRPFLILPFIQIGASIPLNGTPRQ